MQQGMIILQSGLMTKGNVYSSDLRGHGKTTGDLSKVDSLHLIKDGIKWLVTKPIHESNK